MKHAWSLSVRGSGPRADDNSFECVGDGIDIVLVDKRDAFVFGFSKLDVMFGRQLPAAVRHRHRDVLKPGRQILPDDGAVD